MTTELIFVSYSSQDRPFAIAFAKELQSLGANVWIDQLGIKLGENWDNAIEKALDNSETFMLFLSPTSVESQNVQDEVSIAIQDNKKLVPILIKECDLPMRWKRRQYADLTSDPDKALNDVLEYLGLEQKAANDLRKLLDLIDVTRASKPEPRPVTSPEPDDIDRSDLLVSDEEIDRVILMHKRAIKKNWALVGLAFAVSLVLISVALLTEILPIPQWMAILAGASANFISYLPVADMKKRQRKITLFDLMKLNRARLIRVINKLTETEIQDFNSKFEEYLK